MVRSLIGRVIRFLVTETALFYLEKSLHPNPKQRDYSSCYVLERPEIENLYFKQEFNPVSRLLLRHHINSSFT
ncbi:hypothetical protein DET49_11161 [Salegentibacter sp. 24]|nr:hypothetical protein DET49_11161 [Salegentibacter sp. 24]